MPIEQIPTLFVGGQTWKGWTRLTVQYSVEQAVRQFAATTTDGSTLDPAWNFMPGTPVQVQVNGITLCTGYIDTMTPSYEGANHKIELSGRSKAADSVDCSHEHPTSELKNVTLLDIAKQLDVHGVGYSTDQQLKKIPVFRLEPHETVFGAIERAARKQGYILIGQADGSVKISRAGTTQIHPDLVEGKNILGASATFDNSDRHSKVNIRGQRAYGQSKLTSLQIKGQAKDTGVTRNRTKSLTHENDGGPDDAQSRAEWARDQMVAKSISASVRVYGWLDENGSPWTVNTLIYIKSPMLKLDRMMLLSAVELQIDDQGGTIAQLTLKPPSVHGGPKDKQPSKPTGNDKVGTNAPYHNPNVPQSQSTYVADPLPQSNIG